MKRQGPQPIGNIVAQLMAQNGFARVRDSASIEAAWREAAGELVAEYTHPGTIRKGTLEVSVANSMLIQELVFQKPLILQTLKRLLPDQKIQDVRFRVGPIA